MPVHLKSSFNASLRHNNDEVLERFRQKMACEVKEYFIVPDDWRTLEKFKNIMLHNFSMSSFILAIAKTMNSK